MHRVIYTIVVEFHTFEGISTFEDPTMNIFCVYVGYISLDMNWRWVKLNQIGSLLCGPQPGSSELKKKNKPTFFPIKIFVLQCFVKFIWSALWWLFAPCGWFSLQSWMNLLSCHDSGVRFQPDRFQPYTLLSRTNAEATAIYFPHSFLWDLPLAPHVWLSNNLGWQTVFNVRIPLQFSFYKIFSITERKNK